MSLPDGFLLGESKNENRQSFFKTAFLDYSSDYKLRRYENKNEGFGE